MTLLTDMQASLAAADILVLDDQNQRVINPFGDLSGATVVLRPADTETLSTMLALCHQHRQPLIPIGGATGLSGGTRRVKESGDAEWYLSTERMTAISDFDPINQTVTVQPGVVLSVLQGFARDRQLDFPVDFGARDSATLGGLVATNAGGEMAFRFGMTREQVLGLEVVLADGQVLDVISDVRKNNTGLDLKQLFIGSEGTLGVISRISLKLTERGHHSRTALIGLDSFAQALPLKSLLSQSMTRSLCAFEYMDAAFFDAVLHGGKHQQPLEASYEHYALVELESGNEADLELFESVLGEAWEKELLLDVVISQNDTQSGSLWAIRNDIESMHEYQISSIPFDVSVSLSRAEAFVAALKQQLAVFDPQLRLLVWGHLGDNNLHLNIGGLADTAARKQAICDLVYAEVDAVSGSISAEHGIGYDKQRWLSACRSELAQSLSLDIKRQLDPFNLMNPGKVYGRSKSAGANA